MGGRFFKVVSEGNNAEIAFEKATTEACYLYGHGGYSGTIAEKCEFIETDLLTEINKMISIIHQSEDWLTDDWGKPIPLEHLSDNGHVDMDILNLLKTLLSDSEPKLKADALVESYNCNFSHWSTEDKWGPAACIKISKGKYIFFGTASA